MPEAQRLWMQARSLDPSLRRPAWLDQKPATLKPSDAVSPVQALMKQVAALEYRDAAPLLEDWLRRFPNDSDVRKYYLMRAEAAQDASQVQRHQAILHPEAVRGSTPWWKYLALILFGALLPREAVSVLREWRTRRNSEQP